MPDNKENFITMLCIRASYETKANMENNIEMFFGKELKWTQIGLA
jgi:hypothetical protein